LEALKAAALLHDIGKLAVPEHIISKSTRWWAPRFWKE
jgi:HD-GYP domain-containing protein (c-di-GMP phosphodiesterase class II)